MKSHKNGIPAWAWVVMILLLAMTVPWYWGMETIEPVRFGLPVWTWVSLAVSLLFAVCTAAIIMYCWKDDEEGAVDQPDAEVDQPDSKP